MQTPYVVGLDKSKSGISNRLQSIVLSVGLLCAFVITIMSGCDLAKPQNQQENRQPAGMEGAADVPQDPPAQQESAPKEDDTVTVKAEVGVGSKGSSYAKPTGGPMDIITVPISAGFRTRERISFMLIDDAMNKFKAEHDRLPDSHAEFVMEIIQKGNIMLPKLPEGQEYIYDPKDGELKVRKPRDTP